MAFCPLLRLVESLAQVLRASGGGFKCSGISVDATMCMKLNIVTKKRGFGGIAAVTENKGLNASSAGGHPKAGK